MKFRITLVAALAAIVYGRQTFAVEFYEYPDPVDSVVVLYPDDIGGPFFPEENLIQGAGLGFDEDEPHDALGLGESGGLWVTTADCGFPCDYIEGVGMPVIQLDLGSDVLLDEISTWGYSDTNTNGMREFMLRFATDAEGTDAFGTSITYNPTFIVEDFFEFLAVERRSFEFSEQVTARYVELTVTDNYFDDPGDGTGDEGWGPGGDRVGIGEIAFRIPDATDNPCDFDGDGSLGLGDVNVLLSQVKSGANDLQFDVTGDGVVDAADVSFFVSDAGKLNSWVGDTNLDGEFNSTDLVGLFQAGEFEDGVAMNSTWATGDFNGDGEFGTGDLVAAFQGGGFEQGPRAAVASVPEPSAVVLILFAGLGLVRFRRR